MREAKVSDEIPTRVLLYADLGTMVSYFEPSSSHYLDLTPKIYQLDPLDIHRYCARNVGVPSGQYGDERREEVCWKCKDLLGKKTGKE